MPPKSDIWKHFTKTNNNFALCKLCGKHLKSCGNTTNLIGHLKAKQNSIYANHFTASKTKTASRSEDIPNTEEMPSTSSAQPEQPAESTGLARQQSLENCFNTISSFKDGGHTFNRITTAILYMICRDSQPISIVDDDGFKYLLKVTAPMYKVPSRRTIDNLLDTKDEYISSLVKAELQKVPHVCLTTDIWTETHKSRSFLGINAHFISDSYIDSKGSFHMENVTTGAFKLNERHTGENLAVEISTKCSEWGISKERVITVVTDGGANIIKAVEIPYGRKHTYSTLLDPRFKNLHFEDSVALATAIRKLSTEIKENEEYSVESDGQSSSTNSPRKTPSGLNFWDDHHKLVQENWKANKDLEL
ncbi:E3 SUMO-protein ligase ZBED1-like [Haematobia irritans]|uniref:E3 SUMO-protein ligase ZBED1-like n=1 Tax=Haematobia irritans TaxID=7368 RepID=UPI003F4FF8E4